MWKKTSSSINGVKFGFIGSSASKLTASCCGGSFLIPQQDLFIESYIKTKTEEVIPDKILNLTLCSGWIIIGEEDYGIKILNTVI